MNRKTRSAREKRQVKIHENYARNHFEAHGRCPKCGMGAHRPDQWCNTVKEED